MLKKVLRSSEKPEFLIPEGSFITELSNTPEDSEVSIARTRVPAGVTTALHLLQGVGERYVILEGTGQVEVGQDLVQNVGPNDVVWIPRGVSQRITNTGNSDLVFLCICTPRYVPTCYEPLEPEFEKEA